MDRLKRFGCFAFDRLDRRGYCWPVLITFLRLLQPRPETEGDPVG